MVLATTVAASFAFGESTFSELAIKSFDIAKKSKRKKISKNRKKIIAAALKQKKIEKSLDALASQLRTGEIKEKQMWVGLNKVSNSMKPLPKASKVRIFQTQAQMLLDDKYPVIAAIYASQAIKLSGKPFDPSIVRSWAILKEVSQDHPIQNLMENLAEKLHISDKEAPKFGSDWFYYVGNSFAHRKKYNQAIEAYAKVTLVDRYYFPAKFHEAITQVQRNNLEEAEIALKKILFSTSQDLSELDDDRRLKMNNMVRLALGRIYYETRDFEKSFRAYRGVTKESPQYYDSLFEQAWAFFMGGFPNHALGAIHSIDSPFFNNRDNPESSMLKSMVYFWMCHYKESRAALAEFTEKHKKSVDGLSYFLDRSHLNPETAYELFENYVTGVSSESLGIPRALLAAAASQDGMMQVRDQYATVLTEKSRLAVSGVYRTRIGTGMPMVYLESWEKSLRRSIGKRFLSEVTAMRDTYTQLHEQAQFLEVELLMSEKDHMLGKELHASNKMVTVSTQRDLTGWSNQSRMSWADSGVEEFWWDEVGYYIYEVRPQCNVH